MNLRFGVMRGALSLAGGNIAANVLTALALFILARLLTPEDFGIVAIATAVLSVVQSCTELSLNNALIQKERVDRTHIDTAWTMALIRSGAICAIFALAAWPLSMIYGNGDLVLVFLVSGIGGAIMGLQNPMIWLETKQMTFRPLVIAQFLRRALGVIIAVILALILRSYWAIILGTFIGALASSIISYLLVPYRPRLTLKHVREIWSFSGWMFLSQIFETLNWRIDQLIVGLALPKGQLGVYAMADNLAVIPTRETVYPIRYALFPGLATISQDSERLRRSHLRSQSTVAMLIAPLGVGLALVAEPFVELALGNQWTEAVPYVQIFSMVYIMSVFSIGLQPVAMSLNRTKFLFWRQSIAFGVKVPAIVAGLFSGGMVGAALGRLCADVASALIELFFLKRLLGIAITTQLAQHALTCAGLLAMSIAVTVVGRFVPHGDTPLLLELAVEIATGAIVYIAVIGAAYLGLGRPDGPVRVIADAMTHLRSRKQVSAT